ncbi:MAG: hypothetical protein KVP17_001378 [Porospora cf. gigantea B]|uniref:uncharacterized protein n=1 Tax=Porospora cf. gigantea B TaxID=2853592 RepID=UPI003571CFAE|nr:MAG: hypothetical protein KVP17_001378 [Porospora cf. gigantea B]
MAKRSRDTSEKLDKADLKALLAEEQRVKQEESEQQRAEIDDVVREIQGLVPAVDSVPPTFPNVKQLEELMEHHPDLEYSDDGTRVKVKSTGHEMPMVFKTVKAYLCGHAYRRKYISCQMPEKFDFDSLKPFVVPHSKKNNCLVSVLTGHKLNRTLKDVAAEFAGRRFENALREHVTNQLAAEAIQLRKRRKKSSSKVSESESEAGVDFEALMENDGQEESEESEESEE